MSQTAFPQPLVRVGHSPDPDDAFMFHAMVNQKIDTGGLRIEQIHQDIETLNRRALAGELELTAISIHAYAYLADRYRLMNCGASMGDGYGPRIVARGPLTREALRATRVAVPGKMTSAFLALGLYLGGEFPYEEVAFDEIMEQVRDGRFDAGLLIHEGQLTYGDHGLTLVADLGEWWAGKPRACRCRWVPMRCAAIWTRAVSACWNGCCCRASTTGCSIVPRLWTMPPGSVAVWMRDAPMSSWACT